MEDGGANNIFSGLTRAQFRDARQTIVQAILGTDMSSHMQHCADVFQLAQKVKRLSADGEGGVRGRTLGRGSPRGAGCAGGARDKAAFLPPMPLNEPVFSVNEAEDRSFLTKTIVHWCVCVCGGSQVAGFRVFLIEHTKAWVSPHTLSLLRHSPSCHSWLFLFPRAYRIIQYAVFAFALPHCAIQFALFS